MKIATWNVERPRQPKTASIKNKLLLEKLKALDADILILTETNSCIDLGIDYVGFASRELMPCRECEYTAGENRTTVWIKKAYSASNVTVSDKLTSVCVSVKLEQTELLVYGTVVGILGHPSQNVDEQIADWRRISESGTKCACIAGDFNIQFDNLEKCKSRDKVVACLSDLGITNLTSGIAGNVDHIAISDGVLRDAPHAETYIWNLEKESHVPKLSDHIGVSVTLDF